MNGSILCSHCSHRPVEGANTAMHCVPFLIISQNNITHPDVDHASAFPFTDLYLPPFLGHYFKQYSNDYTPCLKKVAIHLLSIYSLNID